MMNRADPQTRSEAHDQLDLKGRAFKLLYDRLPGQYNALVAVFGYQAPALVAGALAEHMETSKAASILDAGCGTGLTAEAVLQRFPKAVIDGFDLSPDMLREASKTKHYRSLQEADATASLPYPHARFDAAVSSGLYTDGHVGPEALRPVLDAIKPGGLFALNIFDSAWEKLGFEKAIDHMVTDGLITVLRHERATHFGRIGQTCRVLVLDKRS